MPLEFSLLIALAVTLGMGLASITLTSLMKVVKRQQEQIQSVTNLLVSKDLAAFTTLQATTNNKPSLMNHPDDFQPLNDESVARLLGERYSSHGIDPGLAYASQDDPMEEFGGKAALF